MKRKSKRFIAFILLCALTLSQTQFAQAATTSDNTSSSRFSSQAVELAQDLDNLADEQVTLSEQDSDTENLPNLDDLLTLTPEVDILPNAPNPDDQDNNQDNDKDSEQSELEEQEEEQDLPNLDDITTITPEVDPDLPNLDDITTITPEVDPVLPDFEEITPAPMPTVEPIIPLPNDDLPNDLPILDDSSANDNFIDFAPLSSVTVVDAYNLNSVIDRINNGEDITEIIIAGNIDSYTINPFVIQPVGRTQGLELTIRGADNPNSSDPFTFDAVQLVINDIDIKFENVRFVGDITGHPSLVMEITGIIVTNANVVFGENAILERYLIGVSLNRNAHMEMRDGSSIIVNGITSNAAVQLNTPDVTDFNDRATFTMYDGSRIETISGGMVQAVEIHGGTFTMNGGLIRNVVYSFTTLSRSNEMTAPSMFIMNGGLMEQQTMPSNTNAGIFLGSGRNIVTINGGTIRNATQGVRLLVLPNEAAASSESTFNFIKGSIEDSSQNGIIIQGTANSLGITQNVNIEEEAIIQRSSENGILVQGNSLSNINLTATGGTITNNGENGINITGTNAAANVNVNLRDLDIINNDMHGVNIEGLPNPQTSITNVTIDNNGENGVNIAQADANAQTAVIIEETTISRNQHGVNIAAENNHATIGEGTRVTNNEMHGVNIAGETATANVFHAQIDRNTINGINVIGENVNLEITDSQIDNNQNNGVNIAGTNVVATVDGQSQINNNQAHGVNILGTSNNVIIGENVGGLARATRAATARINNNANGVNLGGTTNTATMQGNAQIDNNANGVFVTGNGNTANLTDNATIRENTRGVFLESDGTFNMSTADEYGIIANRTTETEVGVNGNGSGAGIFMPSDNATFNMTSGRVFGNVAERARGGGLAIMGNSTFHMTNGLFAQNQAQDGGAIAVYNRFDGLENMEIAAPVLFTGNFAARGVFINDPLAEEYEDQILPNLVSILPYSEHAFTNWDIWVRDFPGDEFDTPTLQPPPGGGIPPIEVIPEPTPNPTPTPTGGGNGGNGGNGGTPTPSPEPTPSSTPPGGGNGGNGETPTPSPQPPTGGGNPPPPVPIWPETTPPPAPPHYETDGEEPIFTPRPQPVPTPFVPPGNNSPNQPSGPDLPGSPAQPVDPGNPSGPDLPGSPAQPVDPGTPGGNIPGTPGIPGGNGGLANLPGSPTQLIRDRVTAETPGTDIAYNLRIGSTDNYVTWNENNGVRTRPRSLRNEQLVMLNLPIPIVDGAYQHGAFIIGYPEEDVRPDGYMTRAEIAQGLFRILVNTQNNTGVQSNDVFSDVSPTDWFYEPVAYFANNGVILGTGFGDFRPGDNMTNAEFATILTRALHLDRLPSNGTNLAAAEGHWGEEYLNIVFDERWFEFFGDNYVFDPNAPITRAESVTLVNYFTGRLPNPHDINVYLEGGIMFPDLTREHWGFYEVMTSVLAHRFQIEEDIHHWLNADSQTITDLHIIPHETSELPPFNFSELAYVGN